MRPRQKRIVKMVKKIFPRRKKKVAIRQAAARVQQFNRRRGLMSSVRRKPRFSRRKYTPSSRAKPFYNKVINALTKTQPTSIHLEGEAYSISSAADTTNNMDKYFPITGIYSKFAIQNIFGAAQIDVTSENLWTGAWHLNAELKNNSSKTFRLRVYKATFRDDLPTSEIAAYDPVAFNTWIYEGFQPGNSKWLSPWPGSAFRNMDLKFNLNTNQWLRIRKIKDQRMNPNDNVVIRAGSAAYKLLKYDRVDSSTTLFYRKHSTMYFCQLTPEYGHDGDGYNFNTQQPLHATAWKMDVNYSLKYFYKKLPNVTGRITSNFTGIQSNAQLSSITSVTKDHHFSTQAGAP